ncbi:lycopene cyclase domain-containing protein [Actinotalea sp.]|uniref:lycopene cyclase domain-containing protein n=1 Tax=Actinotalea sp. TaxID=1872145 RepID=UPI002C9DA2FC|nr:lycopene cyclase domain-containing protein [Actinotalea sp.]HQY32513.1 lycopene cyclase domain-containing protein [Actinotalea sp.]HRA51160.1 lycopene cyclase domain-containing protein [Actinotalea sp.]
MTYVLVSLPFVLLAALALVPARRRVVPRALLAALVALWVLTAVFDNLMISAGLVDYAAEHISGLRVGVAPLEDFTYPLAGVLLLPALWHLLGGRVGSPRPAASGGAPEEDA